MVMKKTDWFGYSIFLIQKRTTFAVKEMKIHGDLYRRRTDIVGLR